LIITCFIALHAYTSGAAAEASQASITTVILTVVVFITVLVGLQMLMVIAGDLADPYDNGMSASPRRP